MACGVSASRMEGGTGFQAHAFQVPSVAPARIRCSGFVGPHRGTGGTTGDLPQGLHRGPDGPSATELLASAGQTSMADFLRRHGVRWLGRSACKRNAIMVKQLLFAHAIPEKQMTLLGRT